MFYEIKDNKVNTWGDYKYSRECLETDIITVSEFEAHPNKVIVQDGILVLNPDYDEEELSKARTNKYQEALQGAKEYIENEAVYQFDANNSIEATDGNIGKMTAYALGFQTGTIEAVYWTSKEDNVLTLNAEDVLRILTGLGEIQSVIWNVKFVAYKNQIETALTIEEIEAIVIDYGAE